jgi:uncharacterized RDD family membrane protein YckC
MADEQAAGIKGGEKSCGWCGRTISAESLVCPHCATEVSNRATVLPGRHGPRVRERPIYGNHLIPDLTTRFLGRLIDGIVAIPVVLIVAFVLHDNGIAVALAVLAVLTYETSCIAIWGQTIGKRVEGTRVIGYRSGALTPAPAQAFVRAAVWEAPSLLLLAPRPSGPILEELAFAAICISILASRTHRGLTDLAAGTIVVDNPPAA